MDVLALLCTLHADGPKTARRLRLAGVEELADLRRVPLADVADALQSELSHAQRFLREADLLRDRVGTRALEDEAPSAAPAPEPIRLMHVADEPPAEPEAREHVLQRYVINPLIRPVKGGLRVRKLPAAPPTSRLRPDLLSGLDAEACERLQQTGIHTVEALAKASGLDLALDLGWPYDRVFHLKKEASHFVRTERAQREHAGA